MDNLYHCSLILWYVAQYQWVVCYQLFWTTYQSHLRLQNGQEESFLPMCWYIVSVPFQVARMSRKFICTFWESISPIATVEMSKKNNFYLCFWTALQGSRCLRKMIFTHFLGQHCKAKKIDFYPYFRTALPGSRYPRRIINTHILGQGISPTLRVKKFKEKLC